MVLSFSVLVRFPDAPVDRRKQLQRQIWNLFVRNVPQLPGRTEDLANRNQNIVSEV